MNQIEIEPKPPNTYKIKTSTGKSIIINPTPYNTKNKLDPHTTIIIATTNQATQTANQNPKVPVITIHEHANKIKNPDRVIELEENEEHWIDNDTKIVILPKENIYIKTATIEITYLNHPLEPSITPTYTDIILLTPRTTKQHLIQANIHPQHILTPNHKPIKATRHLTQIHITQIKENK